MKSWIKQLFQELKELALGCAVGIVCIFLFYYVGVRVMVSLICAIISWF